MAAQIAALVGMQDERGENSVLDLRSDWLAIERTRSVASDEPHSAFETHQSSTHMDAVTDDRKDSERPAAALAPSSESRKSGKNGFRQH